MSKGVVMSWGSMFKGVFLYSKVQSIIGKSHGDPPVKWADRCEIEHYLPATLLAGGDNHLRPAALPFYNTINSTLLQLICVPVTSMVDIMNNFVFNTLAEVTVQFTSPRCALIMVLKALIIPFTLFRRLLSARVSKTKVKFNLTFFLKFCLIIRWTLRCALDMEIILPAVIWNISTFNSLCVQSIVLTE